MHLNKLPCVLVGPAIQPTQEFLLCPKNPKGNNLTYYIAY